MTTALASDVREYTWRVRQGADDPLTIPIYRGGVLFPVDGWPVDAKVKTRPGGLVLYTWPAELITIVGSDVTLKLPKEVSLAWPWSSAWYRVKLTDPDTDNPDGTSRVLQGPIYLDLD